MTVLRSPILIFGILLIVLATVLGIAPYFINWNSYRPLIAGYASDLTGRPVTLTGNVSARLFPWPSLRVEGVHVGNAPGAQDADFAHADAVEAKFLLGSLLGGHFEVASIRIEAPLIALERMKDGSVNWHLAPKPDVALPRTIAFDTISLSGGTVVLRDAQRGGVARLGDFTAGVSAPALQGPWKLKGTATGPDGEPISISLGTGRLAQGEDLKFSLRLAPDGGPGLVYETDGAITADGFDGTIRIAPYVEESGKGNSESDLRQLGVSAAVALRANRLALSKIEIAPVSGEVGASLLTGDADIRLGREIAVTASFSAPRFDLDSILGSRGKEMLRSGAVLGVVSDMIGGLPDGVTGRLRLDLGALLVGSDTIERVKLAASLTPNGLAISELFAGLPGQTDARFTGELVTAGGAPRLAGDVNLKARGLRDLLGWLVPEWHPAIAETWNGTRGALALTSHLDMAPGSFALTGADFTLDGAKGEGSLTLASGDRPGLTLHGIIDSLDLDSYFSNGLPPVAPQGIATREHVALTLHLGKLRLRGVEANGVNLEAASDAKGLTVKALSIDDVGTARFQANGSYVATKPSGTARLTVEAQDPRGLLKLAGLDRLAVPGPLKLNLDGEAHTPSGQTLATLNGTVTAGASTIDVSATYGGSIADLTKGNLALTARAESPGGAELAGLFGLKLAASVPGEAVMRVSARGRVADGLDATLDLRGFGGTGNFRGSATVAPLAASGEFAVDTQDVGAVLAILGVSLPASAAALVAQGRITTSAGEFAIQNLSGQIAGAAVSGSLSLTRDELAGDLTTARLSLPWLMQALLIKPDATVISATTLFAKPPLAGLRGGVNIRADQIEALTGFAVPGAVSFAVKPQDGLTLAVKSDPLTIALTAAQREGDIHIMSDIKAAVPLASLLADQSGAQPIAGTATLDAHLDGRGRSPAGFIMSASGSGSLALSDLVLANADPAPIAIAATQGPGALDAALARAGQFKPAATAPATLSLSNGVVTATPVALTGQGGNGAIIITADLAAGHIDAGLSLTLPNGKLPAYEIAWSGPLRQLARTNDVTALRAALQSRAIQADMKKLEELQREQQRLAQEEQDRRRKLAEEQKRKAAAEDAAATQAAEDARRLEEAAAARIAAEKAAKPQPPPPPSSPSLPPLLPTEPDQISIIPLPRQ